MDRMQRFSSGTLGHICDTRRNGWHKKSEQVHMYSCFIHIFSPQSRSWKWVSLWSCSCNYHFPKWCVAVFEFESFQDNRTCGRRESYLGMCKFCGNGQKSNLCISCPIAMCGAWQELKATLPKAYMWMPWSSMSRRIRQGNRGWICSLDNPCLVRNLLFFVIY